MSKHNAQVEYERQLFQLCKQGGKVDELSHLLTQPGVDPNIFDEVKAVENTAHSPAQTI